MGSVRSAGGKRGKAREKRRATGWAAGRALASPQRARPVIRPFFAEALRLRAQWTLEAPYRRARIKSSQLRPDHPLTSPRRGWLVPQNPY